MVVIPLQQQCHAHRQRHMMHHRVNLGWLKLLMIYQEVHGDQDMSLQGHAGRCIHQDLLRLHPAATRVHTQCFGVDAEQGGSGQVRDLNTSHASLLQKSY